MGVRRPLVTLRKEYTSEYQLNRLGAFIKHVPFQVSYYKVVARFSWFCKNLAILFYIICT